jgi:hypothetical protein
MAAPITQPAAERSGSGFLAGSVIMVILNGFVSTIRSRAGGQATSYIIGTMFGGAVLFGLIAAVLYGIATAIKKPASRRGRLKLVFWTLVVLFILHLLSALGSGIERAGAQVISQEERNGLRVSTDSIWNTPLGFTLPSPGPTFVATRDAERRAAEQFGGKLPAELAMWSFRDTSRIRGLAIQVTKLAGLNEKGFRDFARGLREGVQVSRVIADSVFWERARREAVLSARHPNGLYLMTRCVPRTKPPQEFVVCVQTFSDDLSGLAAVSNGLRVMP